MELPGLKNLIYKKGLNDPICDGNPQKLIELADELISCSLPEGQDEESKRLKKVVMFYSILRFGY